MRSAIRNPILFGGGGVVAPTPWFLDTFLVAESAPLASPHAANTGSLTLVQNDSGSFGIASNELTIVKPTAGNFGDLYGVDISRARVCGRAWGFTVNPTAHSSNGASFGFNDDATPFTPSTSLIAGVQLGVGSFFIDNKSLVDLNVDLLTNGVDHTGYVIMRDTGSWFVLNNKIEWIGAAGTAAGFPNIQSSTLNGKLKTRLIGVDLNGIWTTQNGPVTNRVAAPANGEITTSIADGWCEFTWTPAAAETMEISFRRTDDDNRYIIRCDQAGGTIKVYKREAAVETELTGGTTTQTWTAGTPRRIVVRFTGTTIRTWVANTKKNAATATSFNLTATGVKVAGFATGTEFVTWPWVVPDPYPFDLRYYATLGDSKTAAELYQATLTTSLRTSTGAKWKEVLPSPAVSGYRASDFAGGVIDTFLAQMHETPEFMLLNLGANDVVSLPTSAQWKGYMREIFRAVHGKWGSCPIYLMDTWRRTYATESNTLATWRSELRAESEFSYVRQGPDERVFLENGDDGVTYTADGIHPNAAGYVLTAGQWKTAAGY